MSIHSPKNKYSVDINFKELQKGLAGNSVNYTAESIEQCKALAIQQAGSGECTITIRENKKEYPLFDWQVVEKYKIIK